MKTFVTRRFVIRLLWILGVAVVGFVAYAWRSSIPPIDAPAAESFDAQSVQRGAQLAALGDCATCHTAPGGETFAGGRAVLTPFGTIYSTNITPDPTTGIGHWSEAAFQRAMREGVDREGDHLYPAFPYDHFTLVSDADSAALYAFVMTRQPVQARTPENQLPFPLNMRFILAGWKLLFFRKGPYEPDLAHDEQWNRGAYLANGIGHCGACHTPRNSFGAEISAQHFAGGEAEGWYAYAINADSKSFEAWNAQDLHMFLSKGWHDRHGDAHGPMAPVSQNLASVPDSDVKAIATYVASVMGKRDSRRKDLCRGGPEQRHGRRNLCRHLRELPRRNSPPALRRRQTHAQHCGYRRERDQFDQRCARWPASTRGRRWRNHARILEHTHRWSVGIVGCLHPIQLGCQTPVDGSRDERARSPEPRA